MLQNTENLVIESKLQKGDMDNLLDSPVTAGEVRNSEQSSQLDNNLSKKVTPAQGKAVTSSLSAKRPPINITAPLSQSIFEKNGAKNPLATVENLEKVLNGYAIECYYDEILKRQFIVFPNDGSDRNELSLNSKLQQVRSLLALNLISESAIDKLIVVMNRRIVNPIIQFITESKWDGISRFDALSKTIVVSKEHEQLRDMILRRWLIQCVAAADGAKNTPNRIAKKKYELVLTFQGNQGIKKTSWFRALLPQKYGEYILDGAHIDTNNRDSVKTAISCWICEIGEIDATFKKSDVSRLKAFLSKGTDSMRLPYDRADSEYRRTTSFCASVNDENFLVDQTGNRRYGVIPVNGVICDHNIPMQQLWAEIWSLYLSGEQWWLTDSEFDVVNSSNNNFMLLDPIAEAISLVFDVNDVSGNGEHYTATEILRECGYKEISKIDLNRVSPFLKKCGHEKKKVQGAIGFRLLKRSSFND